MMARPGCYRMALLVLCVLTLSGLTGCLPEGKLTVTNALTIHPYGHVSQSVELRGTGFFAKSLRAGTGEWEDLRRIERTPGWTVEKRLQGDTALVRLSRTFPSFGRYQAGNMHQVASRLSSHYPFRPGRSELRTRNLVLVRYYDYREEWQGTVGDQGGIGVGPGMLQSALAGMAEGLINSRLRMNYRIRLPGRIADSNADTVSGDTAMWSCGLAELDEGRALWASSRYVDWYAIGSLALLLAATGGIVLFVRTRRERTSEELLDQARGELPDV